MDFTSIKAITIPQGNVTQIAVGSTVLWKSSPLPSAYQRVEWIRNSTGSTTNAYIDLGFAFDTAATIYLHYRAETGSAYVFGAAESSGKYRCMITSTTTDEMFYGSNGSGYIANGLTGGVGEYNIKYRLKEGWLSATNWVNGESQKGITQAAYTMTRNLYLFAQNYNGSARFGDIRRISYFKYYDKNDTVPYEIAQKGRVKQIVKDIILKRFRLYIVFVLDKLGLRK